METRPLPGDDRVLVGAALHRLGAAFARGHGRGCWKLGSSGSTQPSDLGLDVIDSIRAKSDLGDNAAMQLAYDELHAMRRERREAAG